MSFVITAGGQQMSVADPRPESFNIEDIAEALSKECRFNGHCRGFYSVAQHSVLVSQIVPPKYTLDGLLHDASEAYLHDLVTPIKSLSGMRYYRKLQRRYERAIAERFHLRIHLPICVKEADRILLATEKRDLMPFCEPWPILDGVDTLPIIIEPLEWREARDLFLERYEEITACKSYSMA